MAKNDFEFHGASKLIAPFEIVSLSVIWCKEHTEDNFAESFS